MSSAAFDAGARAALVKVAGPQTRGEFDVETGAGGLGATRSAGADVGEHVVRGPGNQGPRRGSHGGVPAWVRAIGQLRSRAVAHGGDKVGPRADDNQFQAPYREQSS